MAIPDSLRNDFDFLAGEIVAGNCALLECQDAATGKPRYFIAIITPDGQEYAISPMAEMFAESPIDDLRLP